MPLLVFSGVPFALSATNVMACAEGGTYVPVTPLEKRLVVVEFSYPGSNGTQTLPSLAINSVPYAMYAGEAINAEAFWAVQ